MLTESDLDETNFCVEWATLREVETCFRVLYAVSSI